MSTTIPSTMKAWNFSRKGTPRQVLALHDVPSPAPPTSDKVLIRVAYTGLNPGDTKTMRLIPNIVRPRNSCTGFDYAGTIVATGPSAPSHLQVNTRVFGVLGTPALLKGEGALCEYISLSPKSHAVLPVPDGVDLREASALGSAGLMAFLTCKRGNIKAGNNYRVLINGASGGCGSMLVQVLRARGAREIIATCSAPNSEFVLGLGADRVIDYRAHDPLHIHLAEEFAHQPFDLIVDTVGLQSLYTNCARYLKPEGVFINIGDYASGLVQGALNWFLNAWRPVWLGGTPRRYIMFAADVEHDVTEQLRKSVEDGEVKAIIDKEMAWEDTIEALEMVDTKRTRGRIVVKVQQN